MGVFERRGDENRRWELRLNGGSRSGQLRKSRHSASHFASHVTSDCASDFTSHCASDCASHFASDYVSNCASHYASHSISHCASPFAPYCASHFTSHSVSSPSSCDGHSGAHLLYL